jgi:broad specificity phosphatase PhoE
MSTDPGSPMPRLVRSLPAVARALALFVLIIAIAAARPIADTTTTVIVVRHAEKEAVPADDPPLTAVGEARAAALLESVQGAGVGAIYSTRYKRTRSTVTPLAEKLGVPITVFEPPPAARNYGELYAAEILAKHRGKVVLVVGHSNTVPNVLRGFGIQDPPALTDADYDNLFIVTIPEAGPARLVRAKYGVR